MHFGIMIIHSLSSYPLDAGIMQNTFIINQSNSAFICASSVTKQVYHVVVAKIISVIPSNIIRMLYLI